MHTPAKDGSEVVDIYQLPRKKTEYSITLMSQNKGLLNTHTFYVAAHQERLYYSLMTPLEKYEHDEITVDTFEDPYIFEQFKNLCNSRETPAEDFKVYLPYLLLQAHFLGFIPPTIDEINIGDKGAQITIGDLHGNAIKLLFMLFRHGVASGLTARDYNELVNIYTIPVDCLTETYLQQFNELLEKIVFRKDVTIRLIGDELADRGSNDYFTLLILDKLHQKKVDMEILFSNHSAEFITCFEANSAFNSEDMLGDVQAASMYNLQIIIEKKLVDRAEIEAIVNRSYKPAVKALSYTLNKKTNTLTLYSHAPIDLHIIKGLADKLGVNYQDQSIMALVLTIHLINHAFTHHLNNNTVSTLYSRENIKKLNTTLFSVTTDVSFERLLWNRNYALLDRAYINADYYLYFVHGHDRQKPTCNNIVNLDNLLGKGLYEHIGDYTFHYSHDIQFKPTDRASAITLYLSVNDELKKMTQYEVDAQELLLIQQIYLMMNKSIDLLDRNKNASACAALALCKSVAEGLSVYNKSNKNEDAKETFSATCALAINKERSLLEQHRGWKKILGNLALALLGVGVVLAIACVTNYVTSNGKHFFLFKTESEKILDGLDQKIQHIAPKNYK